MKMELREKGIFIAYLILVTTATIGLLIYALYYPFDPLLLIVGFLFLILGSILVGLALLGKLEKKKI